jgi:hypothetical protein
MSLLHSGEAEHLNYSAVLDRLLHGEKPTPATKKPSPAVSAASLPLNIGVDASWVWKLSILHLEICFFDRVHEHDLLSALSYSLRHEIAMQTEISKEKLAALKIYIRVLSKVFSIIWWVPQCFKCYVIISFVAYRFTQSTSTVSAQCSQIVLFFPMFVILVLISHCVVQFPTVYMAGSFSLLYGTGLSN